MLEVAFHLAMLVVDGLALRHVRRHAGVRGLAVALGGAAGAALLLAWGAMLTQPADPHFGPRFAFLGCLAAGLFLHGPLLLARDREPGIHYEGSVMYPPLPELWG